MDEARARAAVEGGIRWVRMEGADVDGVVHAKRVSGPRFLEDLSGSPIGDLHFSFSIGEEYRTTTWGPWQEGILSDLLLVPDLGTFREVPWESGVAAVMCDWRTTDGAAVQAAPRTVLADQVERLSALGFGAKVAVEYELVLYDETSETAAGKGWRGLTPLFRGKRINDAVRSSEYHQVLGEAIDLICRYGLPVEEVKVEAASGQLELNLAPAPVIEACDHAARLKLSLKELLRRNGVMASFLARPAGAEYGSSGHVHLSLWDPSFESPALWDPRAPDRMSDVMRHAIGGLLATMKPLQAIFCPTLNSGKRLVDNAAVPTTVTWGHENKSVAIRTVTRSPHRARIEHRLAGADSNPYLVCAAILAGLVHGISEKLEPPEPVTTFAWGRRDLDALPRTLREMTDAMDQCELVAKLFDPIFVSHFIATRRWELRQYDRATTDWELARYTDRV
jgi:glutamine synthetase